MTANCNSHTAADQPLNIDDLAGMAIAIRRVAEIWAPLVADSGQKRALPQARVLGEVARWGGRLE
jgi:hypothetical protein